MDDKPALPVRHLIQQAIGDGSDYNDGDFPGWYYHQFVADLGILTLRYEADGDDSPCASTIAVFRLVGSGPAISEEGGENEMGEG